MSKSPANWFSLDRSKSPVQAAVALGLALNEDGRPPILLSQGAETDRPPGDLGRLLDFNTSANPLYNKAVGGPESVRQEAAGFLDRYFGIPASKGNTFVLQASGRQGLTELFLLAASGARNPTLLAPELRWPMIDDIARKARFKINDYDGHSPVRSLRSVLFTGKDVPDAVYVNSPHNPTGGIITADDNRETLDILDIINAGRSGSERKIMLVIDNPYFMACEQNEVGPYLNAGYEKLLDTGGVTPYGIVVSGSKAFGTAQPGFCIVHASDGLKTEMQRALACGVGVSYSPKFFDNMSAFLSPDCDEAVLSHMGALRAKYVENHAQVERILGDYLLKSDPGMVCLLQMPWGLYNRKVECWDGRTREIRDNDDIVEFFANECGVLVVNNGGLYIRLALAEKPDVVRPGLEAIQGGLSRIQNAPTIL